MTPEHWKSVRDFPGYQVSDLGRVRNHRGQILKTAANRSLLLYRDGLHHGVRVARLVGQAFSKAYGPHLYPVFVDGNPANYAARNLRWVPRREITGVPYSRKGVPYSRKGVPYSRKEVTR